MQDETIQNTESKSVSVVDPVTVTTLVAAAAAAASTLLAGLVGGDGKSADPLECVFVNNTPYDWTLVSGFGQPIHGDLEMTSDLLATVPDLITAYNTQTGGEGNVSGWALKSHNEGSEIVEVYFCSTLDLYAAFYGYNPLHKSCKAGVLLAYASDFQSLQNKGNNSSDHQGKWIVAAINGSQIGQSATSSNGVAATVTFNTNGPSQPATNPPTTQPITISVTFAASQQMNYTMEFTGNWPPMPSSSTTQNS